MKKTVGDNSITYKKATEIRSVTKDAIKQLVRRGRLQAAAILGIVAELPSRYHPDGLAASIGAERIGLAGWIIDKRLGKEAELDEETVKQAIADLIEQKFIRITESRRMEATEEGENLWQMKENK